MSRAARSRRSSAPVKKVTDIVAEIAAASREQSSGIEQVNKAIMQMDTTTQQNAALVEQAAAASQAIVEQTALVVGDGLALARRDAPATTRTITDSDFGGRLMNAQAMSAAVTCKPGRCGELRAVPDLRLRG